MNRLKLLALPLLALGLLSPAICAAKQPCFPPPPLHPRPPVLVLDDPAHHIQFQVEGDNHRKIVLVETRGDGLMGVYEPLARGDHGKEGDIVAVRLITAAEMQHFHDPVPGQGHFVLTFRSGGVVVINENAEPPLKPINCADRAPIVRRNIACRIDLEKAMQDEADAQPACELVDDSRAASYKPPPPVQVGAITLHVADDLRTMWASDADGRELWREDPFEVAHMKPYRFFRPLITELGEPSDISRRFCDTDGRKTAAIVYTSTQFACIDARTGWVRDLGQD